MFLATSSKTTPCLYSLFVLNTVMMVGTEAYAMPRPNVAPLERRETHHSRQLLQSRNPTWFLNCRYNGRSTPRQPSLSLSLHAKILKNDQDDNYYDVIASTITSSPTRSVAFSVLISLAGASLGPFLDSYHSAFGVLQYRQPITAALWGNMEHPALITAWWVPLLFGLAGFLIGSLYILLDASLRTHDPNTQQEQLSTHTTPPKIIFGIALFTLQYWLSGVLFAAGVDRTTILQVMSTVAAMGFWSLDGSWSGFLVSTATAVGGPLIEVGLLSLSRVDGSFFSATGYQYTDLGETGFFPLWIVPVYFLGGPAVGNLARGVWNSLTSALQLEEAGLVGDVSNERQPCTTCNDTRRVPCPNCDGVGTYVAMGGRSVVCTSCRGRGFVVCRACFSNYDQDSNDIDAIRDVMSRMPD